MRRPMFRRRAAPTSFCRAMPRRFRRESGGFSIRAASNRVLDIWPCAAQRPRSKVETKDPSPEFESTGGSREPFGLRKSRREPGGLAARFVYRRFITDRVVRPGKPDAFLDWRRDFLGAGF